MTVTLAELNDYSEEKFVEAVGWIFEHSPWVAERAWLKRPFASFDDLSTQLIQEVLSASPNEQLALLCAHPDLGTLAKVGAASKREQSGVGLDLLTQAEHDILLSLNKQYRK